MKAFVPTLNSVGEVIYTKSWGCSSYLFIIIYSFWECNRKERKDQKSLTVRNKEEGYVECFVEEAEKCNFLLETENNLTGIKLKNSHWNNL